MMIDLFFRAEQPGALKTVVTSNAFTGIVGAIIDPDTNEPISRPGEVDLVYFPPDTVVVSRDAEGVPTAWDSWCWLHLRLAHGAFQKDQQDGAGNDRWNKSKLIQHVKDNGTFRTIRGCTVAELAVQGKGFQVWRASDMQANGVLFHEFFDRQGVRA